LATLATNATQMKDNIKNADFYKDLTNGLITGSQNLINKENVEQVVSNLTNVDLSALTNMATSAKSEVKQATSDITDLLSLLQQVKQ
jgi:hypothetical protein